MSRDCVRELKPKHPDILFMMVRYMKKMRKFSKHSPQERMVIFWKKTAPGKLLEAIRELAEGGAPMSSQIARISEHSREKIILQPSILDNLSNREHEILELLAKGMLYKEISTRLGIAQETVRKHCISHAGEAHVNNRVEAVNKYFGR